MTWRDVISKFISTSEAETRKFASEFAARINGKPKISLVGPFGAGKTTFVRGFVEGKGIPAHDVQSPTFTLIRQYGTDNKIFHVDLYRLDDEDEIFEAGIFDLITSDELVLIEWADRLIKYRPEPSILIEFTHGKGTERSIEIFESSQ